MIFKQTDAIMIKLLQVKTIFNDAWLSLVERCVRDAEVAGSNPVASILGRGAGILSLRVSVIFLCKTKNFAMGYENKNKSI